jgi:GNAT superfamily N-acetyltransferase
MLADLVIEPAALAEAEALLALQVLCYQGEARRYEDDRLPPLLQTLESLRGDIREGVVLVARQGDALLGSVRARRAGDVLHIGKLLVHPSRRHVGLGTRLLAAIEAHAGDARWLEVFTGHRSEEFLGLYEKQGYACVATEPVNARLTLVFLRKPNGGGR